MQPQEFKRIRTKLGLTQTAAAEVLGLSSPTAVSNIETGFRNPNRLAKSLLALLDSLPSHQAKALANQLALHNRKQSE
jgi:DNA-binding transcriptional regulator YiaG